MAIMMLMETLIWHTIERRANKARKLSSFDRHRQHFEALNRSKMDLSIMSLRRTNSS